MQRAALTAIASCTVLLLLAGCQRAQPDYEACSSASASAMASASADATEAAAAPATIMTTASAAASPPPRQPVAPDVQKCMEAKGWRLLRPTLTPGSNAWARLSPEANPALARRPLSEGSEHRSK